MRGTDFLLLWLAVIVARCSCTTHYSTDTHVCLVSWSYSETSCRMYSFSEHSECQPYQMENCKEGSDFTVLYEASCQVYKCEERDEKNSLKPKSDYQAPTVTEATAPIKHFEGDNNSEKGSYNTQIEGIEGEGTLATDSPAGDPYKGSQESVSSDAKEKEERNRVVDEGGSKGDGKEKEARIRVVDEGGSKSEEKEKEPVVDEGGSKSGEKEKGRVVDEGESKKERVKGRGKRKKASKVPKENKKAKQEKKEELEGQTEEDRGDKEKTTSFDNTCPRHRMTDETTHFFCPDGRECYMRWVDSLPGQGYFYKNCTTELSLCFLDKCDKEPYFFDKMQEVWCDPAPAPPLPSGTYLGLTLALSVTLSAVVIFAALGIVFWMRERRIRRMYDSLENRGGSESPILRRNRSQRRHRQEHIELGSMGADSRNATETTPNTQNNPFTTYYASTDVTSSSPMGVRVNPVEQTATFSSFKTNTSSPSTSKLTDHFNIRSGGSKVTASYQHPLQDVPLDT